MTASDAIKLSVKNACDRKLVDIVYTSIMEVCEQGKFVLNIDKDFCIKHNLDFDYYHNIFSEIIVKDLWLNGFTVKFNTYFGNKYSSWRITW